MQVKSISFIVFLLALAGIGLFLSGTFTPPETESSQAEASASPAITEPPASPSNETVIETQATSNPNTTTVTVYFGREDETEDCTVVFPATREIEQTPQVGQRTLSLLLEGPTESEQAQGMVTNIPEGVSLQSLNIQNGVARADFSQELNQVGGACRVQAISAQITQSLLQFPTVQEVVISVAGNTEEVLQP